MTFAQTILLGALSGLTIFLGLPVGRMQLLGSRTRVALAMFSVGILAFIFVDVLSHGLSIVHDAARPRRPPPRPSAYWPGCSSCSPRLRRRERRAGDAERRLRPLGPTRPRSPAARGRGRDRRRGRRARGRAREAARRRALRTGLTIAAAIGVHNFAEGLAIGVSARAGAISLATVLIIGFALHNATEGFGIVGPLGDVTPVLALARAGRSDRRRPDLPRVDRRLRGDQPCARARLLRDGGRRDPVRDRRGLERRCAATAIASSGWLC